MKTNQLTRGKETRLMYVENKEGLIDGLSGRIGWVTFSKSGRSVYYRGLTLKRALGGGILGNFYDEATGQEYWVSGVKRRGSNVHSAERLGIEVDEDAREEYVRLRKKNAV